MEAAMAMPQDNLSTVKDRSSPAAVETTLEFGRYRVLVRRRQLVADGVPIELGTRAFDLLLVLLEADGSLVTKDEIMSSVWPGVVVAEENLKVHICALRKALGEDRDFIRTEVGRGYRFTAEVRTIAGWRACHHPMRRAGAGQVRGWFPNGFLAGGCRVGVSSGHPGIRLDHNHPEGADPAVTESAHLCEEGEET
jgi:DNA-binding winged helix-turn-helix (wHTH) protein